MLLDRSLALDQIILAQLPGLWHDHIRLFKSVLKVSLFLCVTPDDIREMGRDIR